jgi:phage-related minor tail protein
MNRAIEGFSKGVAESIVLGKSLQGTLKGVAQTILIEIISAQLKEIAVLISKLAVEKAILAVKTAQASVSGGGGFFGDLLSIGMSAFGGGGMTPIDASVVSPFAEGGSVRGGMPITVGERGRELFVPNTNGTIVPNHDMGSASNITFNIQANDVRGIRELLIDNRATIINLVNQGANQKGKSNIV